MLTSIRSVLLGVAGCAVLPISLASANEARHIATVALVEKPWAVSLDITGYDIHVDGVTPDGRRYLFATSAATSMTLSVTLEMVDRQATVQECLAHLQHIAQGSLAHNNQDVRHHEVRHMPVLEYIGPAVRGGVNQLHAFACVAKENVYADVHISKKVFTPGDEFLVRDLLARLDIVAATPASSLDHFRAGSAPYLRGTVCTSHPTL